MLNNLAWHHYCCPMKMEWLSEMYELVGKSIVVFLLTFGALFGYPQHEPCLVQRRKCSVQLCPGCNSSKLRYNQAVDSVEWIFQARFHIIEF